MAWRHFWDYIRFGPGKRGTYSHGDVGPKECRTQGHQDKRWRDFWVDSGLREEWLERMNDIPGIHITESCAGHGKCVMRDGAVMSPSPMHVEYISDSRTPIEDLERSLADLAEYRVYEDSQSQKEYEDVIYTARTLKKPFIVSEHPDQYGREIRVHSPFLPDELSQDDIDWWWETALWAMEKAGVR